MAVKWTYPPRKEENPLQRYLRRHFAKLGISEINREEIPPDIDKKESLLQRRESLLPICPSPW